MNLKFNYTLSIIISFIFLFAPRLHIVPVSLNFLLLLFLTFLFFCFKKNKDFPNLRKFLYLSIPGFIYCILMQFRYNPFSFLSTHSFSTYYILGIMTLLSSVVVHRYFAPFLAKNPFFILNSICYAALINMSITIFTILIPSSRVIFYSIFSLTAKSAKFLNPETATNLRFSGISTTAFSSYSVLIVYILAILIIVDRQRPLFGSKWFSSFITTISIPLMLLVSILAGRSMIIVLFIIFISYLLDKFVNIAIKLKFKFNLRIKPYLLVASSLLTVTALFYFNKLSSAQIDYYFEVFTNISDLESMATYDALNSMWFLPKSFDTLVFGNGHFGVNPLNRLPTDIGWIYMVHGSGLLGIMLITIPFIALPFLKKPSFIPNFLFVSIPFSFIILNFKDLYFIGPGSFTYLFSCIYLCVYFVGKSKNV